MATEKSTSDPVEVPALSQMGATFAERAAAREAAEKKSSKTKAVDAETDEAENKSVKRSRAAKKS